MTKLGKSSTKDRLDVLEGRVQGMLGGMSNRLGDIDWNASEARWKIDALLNHLGLRVEQIPGKTVCVSTKEEDR